MGVLDSTHDVVLTRVINAALTLQCQSSVNNLPANNRIIISVNQKDLLLSLVGSLHSSTSLSDGAYRKRHV